jgi:hypothetical protein
VIFTLFYDKPDLMGRTGGKAAVCIAVSMIYKGEGVLLLAFFNYEVKITNSYVSTLKRALVKCNLPASVIVIT